MQGIFKGKRRYYKEIDMKGYLVLPGFNDSHMHFIHYAKSLLNVDLQHKKY